MEAESRYLRDILDQPEAVTGTLDALDDSPGLQRMTAHLRNGRFKQVVLTGMGSSCHAFHPLLIETSELGHPTTLIETSELIHYRPGLLAEGTLLVVLSQSGRSAETLRLLEQNAGRAFVAGVTNDPDSPLARQAQACVLTRAGNEYSVSTKTYLASLTGLAWLGSRLTGGRPGFHDGFRAAAAAVRTYLAGWRAHFEEAMQALRGVRQVYLAGRGPSLATALSGGLITKESAHFAAEGMSAAAFRHGPVEMASDATFVLVFAGDPRTAALNEALVRDFRAAGGRAALVRESAEAGWLLVPPVEARARPLVEILPVQMMTLALAGLTGHRAGEFAVTTKVTAVE